MMETTGPSQNRLEPRRLVELLRELNRRRDIDSLSSWFLEFALQLVPQAQAARFLLLDEKSGNFVHRAAVGWDLSQLASIRIPREMAEAICASTQSPSPAKGEVPGELAEQLAALGIASSLPLPIRHRGRLVACFVLDNLTDPQAFSSFPTGTLNPLLEELSWAVGIEYERKARSERDQLFKLVWDRLADALFITTFTGDILECNAAACRQTGYSREELLKLNIMHDIAAQEPAITYEQVNRRLARGETVVFQELKRRKDGTLYWTECAVVQATYGGQPVTISVNRDISDRKKLEEELQRRVEELAAINRALQLIPARLKLEEVIENVVGVAREATRADFAGLILFEEGGKPLRMFNPPGSPPIPLRMRSRGFLAWVLAKKEPLFIHDIREDGTTEPPVIWPGEESPVPVHGLLLKLGIRSLAAVPVMQGGNVTAILTLHSRRPRNFEGQERLLSTLVPQIAVTLDNAFLYEKTKEEEQRWRHLFDESPVSLWVKDFSKVKAKLDSLRERGVVDLRVHLREHPELVEECLGVLEVVEVNRATLRLFRASNLRELVSQFGKIIPPQEISLLREQLQAIWEGRQEFEGVGMNRTLAGEALHIRLRWRVFPGHERDYGRVLVSLVDITPLVEAQRKVESYAEKLASLHRTVQKLQRYHTEGEVCQAAVQGAAEILNFSLCAIALVRGDRLVPVAWTGDVQPQAMPRGHGLAWRTVEEGRSFWGNVGELPGAAPVDERIKSALSVPIGKLGNLQAVAFEPNAFSEEDVRLAEILADHLREELQRVRLERELREQSIRDPLTGLYNRRYLTECLEQELRRAKRYQHPFAVMIVDLDHFKEINDRYGHLQGDQVLKEVATLIRQTVRESDLVFRYGGDEFVILFPETNGKSKVVAQRLRRALRRWWKGYGLEGPPLGISVGVSFWNPREEQSLEEVLEKADAALYRAKRRKRSS